jgi:hypothetical protein
LFGSLSQWMDLRIAGVNYRQNVANQLIWRPPLTVVLFARS